MPQPTTMEAAVPSGTVFEVAPEQRIIRGCVVPYGVEGFTDGQRWTFSRGSIDTSDPSSVKLWMNHDKATACGVAVEFEDRDDGLYAAFKVARGPEGDRALSMAEDGVYDRFSIGPRGTSRFSLRNGIQHAVAVALGEISLTSIPVFTGARVHSVAFDATQEGSTMPEPTPATDPKTTPEDDEPTVPDFSAISGPISDAIAQGFATLAGSEDGPTVVPAGGTATFEVEEESPYRFDGTMGEHDFSTDLIAFGRDRDSEAGERLMAFMAEAFAPPTFVATGDVGTLNPARQRPDMYVDERRFRTPLLDALYKGGLADSTPFVVPRFNTAEGLVADHVEGVEPDPGSFTATSQTITPSAVSGRVEITRETWDQGGNPQVSGLIWRKIVEHYREAQEAKAYALLNALNLPAAQIHLLTAGATDDELVNEVEEVVVDLNFVAGGNTFDYAAAHRDLFKALAAAADASGRKLLPIYGPANANGQARSRFTSLDVAGTEFAPVHTLSKSQAANPRSYLVDTSAAHVWHSAPQRLEFQYRVAYVDLGVWGYCATAVTDAAGIHRLDYKPTAG